MKTEIRVGLFIIVAITIFIYLSLNIGAWRFNSNSFFKYKAYFYDTGGLEAKSPVKIAGVSVGWVEEIALMDSGQAEINLRVSRDHTLFRNCSATIAQDGLIGNRTLEIDPGDSSSGILPPGSTLPMPGKSAATVNDIIETVKEITDTVHEVALSLRGVFSTQDAENKMHKAIENTSQASEKLSSFTTTLDDVAQKNEKGIENIVSNLESSSKTLEEGIPEVKDKIVDTVKTTQDTVEQFQKGAKSMTGTFKSTQIVADRVKRGEGTLGKLVTDDSLYTDVKDTVNQVRDLIGTANDFSIKVDMHTETFYRTDNSRGLAELQLHVNNDYFYNLQLSADQNGTFSRETTFINRYDQNGNLIDTNDKSLTLYEKADVPYIEERITQNRNKIFFGFQFAKKFNQDLTLKVGIFENTFGVAAEYQVPIKWQNIQLSTAVELYDFNGYNRLNDDRPHCRWANKLYFIDTLYTYFGFDDIFSRSNSSVFAGVGLTFDDDNLKYLLSFLPLGKVTG